METHKTVPLPCPSVSEAYRIGLRIDFVPNGCHEWRGPRNTQGYGITHVVGPTGKHHTCRAHRLAWMLHHGADPGIFEVLHKCDNPPCCNPEHLYLGTEADNARDRTERKRRKRGKTAILTPDKVREIRTLRLAGEKQGRLAIHYGVDQSTISDIVQKRTWRDVV